MVTEKYQGNPTCERLADGVRCGRPAVVRGTFQNIGWLCFDCAMGGESESVQRDTEHKEEALRSDESAGDTVAREGTDRLRDGRVA